MATGTGLVLARFRRLLRDAGLLAEATALEKPAAIVFPLVQAEADLSFVQAAAAGEQQIPRLGSIDAFTCALTNVAIRCHGAYSYGLDALRALCENELRKLAERLPSNEGLQNLLALMAEDSGIAGVLRANSQLLAKVFSRYALEVNKSSYYRKGYWSLGAVSRWSADFNLMAGLSHQTLHEFFVDCTGHDVAKGGGYESGKLSFHAFHLLVMAISQRLYAKNQETPRERLAHFLRCMKTLR
jgi:hypothetical protein